MPLLAGTSVPQLEFHSETGSLTVHAQHAPTHVHARFSGTWDVDAAVAAVQWLAPALAESSHRRLLLDTVAMEGDLTLEQRHRMGVLAGRALGPDIRTAVVQQVREHNGYAGRMAQRQGSQLLMFRTAEDALLWLLA